MVENCTVGQFESEEESHREFSRLANLVGCFEVVEKISTSDIVFLPHWRSPVEVFIPDFLLIPRGKLIDAGWPQDDAIIVDAKKTGETIGPGLNQILDYLHARYQVGERTIRPAWAFLWPALSQHSATASIMAHQRIGNVITSWMGGPRLGGENISFFCGESRVLTIRDKGNTIEVCANALRLGRRSGSR